MHELDFYSLLYFSLWHYIIVGKALARKDLPVQQIILIKSASVQQLICLFHN